MIPRYQRILFWSLVGSISFMALFLIRGCHQAHRRLNALNDSNPIAAPAAATPEDVTLYLASDADATITPTRSQVALPQNPTLRARVLLNHLLTQYTDSGSAHPLSSGPAVDDVFLMANPAHPKSTDPATGQTGAPGGQSSPAGAETGAPGGQSSPAGAETAIINLHGSFAVNHPSGVEVEALTIYSIIGTLHDALPQVAQVRFLVDGQPRDTLAGHADLTRTYPAIDTTTRPTAPSEAATQP